MFEFSSVRKCKPRKHILSGFTVMREWIIVYCNPDSTRWSLWMSNGDQVDDLSTEYMLACMHHIRESLISVKKDKDIKVLCFLSKLELCEILAYVTYAEKGWTDTSYYAFCDDFVFVDASALDKDDFTDIDSMLRVISSFDTDVYALKATQASNAKRMFFRGIDGACWEDIKAHGRYMRSASAYRDLVSGTTAGFLDTDFEKCGIILPNVTSFDKSSAYPSKFVQLDCFPLSMPKVYSKADRFDYILSLLETNRWFQIVIYTDKDIPRLRLFKSKYYPTYALCHIDCRMALLDCTIWDALISALDNYKWRLYVSEDQGRLLPEVTGKIVDEWKAKETATTKTERKKHKTQIDMLYGKAIQRQHFDYDWQVKKWFGKGDGTKYLLPHWSRLVVSAVKYEVMSLWDKIPCTIASDTDSIKSDEDFSQLKCFFDEINDKIRERNICSGYDCDIGVWRHEYTADRFLQLTNKQYIYETDGIMHYTLAGFTMPEILQTVDGMTNDEIFNFFKQRPEIPVSQGYTYDWKNDRFSKILQNVKVGDLNVRDN